MIKPLRKMVNQCNDKIFESKRKGMFGKKLQIDLIQSFIDDLQRNFDGN